MRYFLASLILLSIPSFSFAESDDTTHSKDKMLACLQTSIANADETMTVKKLQEACKLLLEQRKPESDDDAKSTESSSKSQPKPEDFSTSSKEQQKSQPAEVESTTVASNKSDSDKKNVPQRRILQDRLTIEALNRSNRFILTPHKRNFLLPVSYMDMPNRTPHQQDGDFSTTDPNYVEPKYTDLNHTEAELQLSVKILLRENIFDDNGHLYLGYTEHAFWQVYNRRLSAPFREADHEPELILSFNNDYEIFGFHNVLNEAILNHQSNGQTGVQSRSWNRIMLNTVFEKDNLAFAFKPWYRLPEDKQEFQGDPKGDDNSDISRYMGHFEFASAYKYKSDIFSIMLRNDLHRNHYGAVEVSWTFPVTKTMRGYVNYFDGYGHSLIDYNSHQQVLGLGIIFTDLF